METNEDKVVAFVVRGSIVALGVLAALGSVFASWRFGAAVLAGGLVALANFRWLKSVLSRAMSLEARRAGIYSLLRYFARLAVTAILLYLLIVPAGLNVFGLLTGLSIIVISATAAIAYTALHPGG